MFKGELYEPQIQGAEFLCNKKRALLAWEQGTGKTIISIAAREKLAELGKIKTPTLVLSPASLCWQFAERIEEFTDARVELVSAKSNRNYSFGPNAPDYVVISYGLFRNDFDCIVKQRWDCVIADEAEAFSNNKSKTYKTMLAFNREVNPTYRWALSGTAVSNALEDLYAILYWTEKTFLPPWPTFEARHIRRHPKFNHITGYKDLIGLNEYLLHRIDRKTEKDLAGKMPKLAITEHLVPRDREYDRAESDLLVALEGLSEQLRFQASTSDGELRIQDPRVSKAFHASRQALIGRTKRSYVVKLVARILREQPDAKLVLFSFYKEPLRELQASLALDGVATESFTGDQTINEKKSAINRFRNASPVLLASNAGARGLDLPFANYVLHLDVPFSYGLMDQRSKRIVRAASKHERVKAIFIMVEDSIEFFYYNLVKNKEKLAKATLEGGDDEVVMKTESLRQFINDKTRETEPQNT